MFVPNAKKENALQNSVDVALKKNRTKDLANGHALSMSGKDTVTNR